MRQRRRRTEAEELHGQISQLGPAASFPWHQGQVAVLRAATDVICVLGGNRSGKSQVAEGVVSRVVRREGPIYRRLRRAEGRPLKVWVAPQTDEKAKSLWEPRLLKMFEGMDVNYVQAPHRIFSWKDAHGGGELYLKTQAQGFLSFESDEVDLCVFDEEPEDRRVVTSAQTRFATTNGVLLLAFTPLAGVTWTHDEYFAPTAKPEYLIGDRTWRRDNAITLVQFGMADNPEAVAGGGVARILNDPAMSQAEKEARLYGRFGYSQGLLVPQFASLTTDSDSPYLLDALPKDRPYRWVLTADPNKRHGALLTSLDHEDNRYYCAEHYAESLPDSEHAEAYRMMLSKFRLTPDDVDAYADPGGAGAQAIINLAEVGFFATAVPKDPGSVGASIKRLRRAAHMDPRHKHPVTGQSPAPHVYFLRSLESRWREGGTDYAESRLLYEFRQYRQKDGAAPDTPVKRKDDVVDCARYVELAHADPAQAPKFDPHAAERAKLDEVSRKEADQFDKMMSKLESQNRRHGARP